MQPPADVDQLIPAMPILFAMPMHSRAAHAQHLSIAQSPLTKCSNKCPIALALTIDASALNAAVGSTRMTAVLFVHRERFPF